MNKSKNFGKPKNNTLKTPIISASILAADFICLGEEIERIIAAGVDYLHFDVMDQHFVPNLTFGPVICQAIRKAGFELPIDVHLMVEHPETLFEAFAKAGANMLIFHPETVENLAQAVHLIKTLNLKAGLAFNPDKPFALSDTILTQIDLILVMSVYPGFAGQPFIVESLAKIKQIHQVLSHHHHIALGVDGGINTNNIGKIAQAGADFFVVGSALFNSKNYQETLKQLRAAIH